MSSSSSDGFLSSDSENSYYSDEESYYSSGDDEEDDDDVDYSQLSCEIDNNLIMPQLTIPCPRQDKPERPKCYQNQCLKVIRIISGPDDEVSAMGNVVQVAGPHGNFIIKWNRYRDQEDIDDIKRELRFQRAAWTAGLAPKVLEVYEQTYKDGSYVYMVMPDLIAMGYRTISELFGKFDKKGRPAGFKNHGKIPVHVLKDISETLLRLHRLGIVHKDLHPGNVFYNPETGGVQLIDFGLSKCIQVMQMLFESKMLSFMVGKMDPVRHFKTKIPKNWSLLVN